jgi:PKD repeat protein
VLVFAAVAAQLVLAEGASATLGPVAPSRLAEAPHGAVSSPVAAAIEPYSADPAETRPYAVCPPPTRLRASCAAAVVPIKHGDPVIGPSLEGGGVSGGFSPADLRSAYELPNGGGAGQTVAITVAFDDPQAESDLATYRSHYGLPACTTANGCFSKVNQEGEEGNYPGASSNWALEASLDLDMVSATCPECHIILVEADNAYLEDLGPAVQKAAELGATVISDSWATEEFAGESAEDHYFDNPGVPTLFASGDWGYGVYYPAASPTTVAVGGTSLGLSGMSRGWSETAWGGAGSGCSADEPKPTWQRDEGCSGRTVADVSAVADPATPVSVYDSFGSSGWALVGGTSVATPLIAGVEALSSNAFRAAGPSGFWRTGNADGLFDVTDGENGACAVESEVGFAATYLCQGDLGYDGPTGWGTPDGPLSMPVAITEGVTVSPAGTATLHGSVDPGGLATEYTFEYGETESYGASMPVPDESISSGPGYVEVSQVIEGLEGQTPYHYRITAHNTAGTFHGVDRTFGTTMPTAFTGEADEIQVHLATVHATVDPEGIRTVYYFEYGTTTSYGHKAPAKVGELSGATSAVPVSSVLRPLTGGTPYHYRVVAKNAAGTVYGGDETLETEPSSWRVAALPQPPNSGKGEEAFGVSCLQPDECVAVGENWDLGVHTSVTLAELWDGASWSVMPTPNPSGLDEGWQYGRYAVLHGVSCASATSCVAVGHYKGPSETVEPLAEVWDGSGWSLTDPAHPPGSTSAALDDVSCATSTNCVAAGYYASGPGAYRTLIERWDGAKWSVETPPNPTGSSSSWLAGISCTSTSICFAAGAYQAGSIEKTLVERWSGETWSVQSTPNPGSRDEARLEAISCPASSACTAVGYYRGGPTLVTLAEHWDGAQWAAQSTPTPDGEGYLWSVSCATPSACTAAGTYYSPEETDHGFRGLIERWSGNDWSVPEIEETSTPSGWWHESSLQGVSCAVPEGCDAVGNSLAAPEGGQSAYHAFSVYERTGPSARFSSSPDSPHTGDTVAFDASSAVAAPGRTIAGYSWSFGDGATGSGIEPSHAYAHAGSYSVTLTVTDDLGKTDDVSHTVDVLDRPPTASFAVTTESPTAGQPTAFDASPSADPDGVIATYGWDFGDGAQGSGPTPSHVYEYAGSYAVKLTVTDNDGESEEISHVVAVGDAPPTVIAPSSSVIPPAAYGRGSSSFAIQRAASDCNGDIALALRAPGPGALEAMATVAASQSFPYGSASIWTSVPGAVELIVHPRRTALLTMRAHPRRHWRVRVAVSFNPHHGKPKSDRVAVLVTFAQAGHRSRSQPRPQDCTR